MTTGKAKLFAQRAGPPTKVNGRAVAAGVVAVLALTVALSAILALVIYTTTITEAHISGLLYYLGLAAVGVGGAISARRARGGGLVHGALTGLAYVAISLMVGAILFPGGAVLGDVGRKLITALLAGSAGGIIGLNV